MALIKLKIHNILDCKIGDFIVIDDDKVGIFKFAGNPQKYLHIGGSSIGWSDSTYITTYAKCSLRGQENFSLDFTVKNNGNVRRARKSEKEYLLKIIRNNGYEYVGENK